LLRSTSVQFFDAVIIDLILTAALCGLSLPILAATPADAAIIDDRTVEEFIWGMPAVNYDLMLQEISFIDDKEGKPVGIQSHISRRPIVAAGNSDGDFQMLSPSDRAQSRLLERSVPLMRIGVKLRES
jgi:hypothetical protein